MSAERRLHNVRPTVDPTAYPHRPDHDVQPYFLDDFPHLKHSQTFENLRNASLSYPSTDGAYDLDSSRHHLPHSIASPECSPSKPCSASFLFRLLSSRFFSTSSVFLRAKTCSTGACW
ncbi:hypothetical protein KC350_g73 [Hortaea werneckii]|nr:hypothetical protein KC350_g73 [Hortaea werneckii]